MEKCIAIITARGGSKRIPGKNIKKFQGEPIIKYSIDAALQSNSFSEVMVSTDNKEIAEIANKLGANIPFLRSEVNSNDFATTADVLKEVILEYKKLGSEFDYGCCIYPTAPFVTSERLKDSFNILKIKKADSVFPVVRFSYPIQRALKIENNRLLMFFPENINVRSQDLTPAYHDAGQFYWFKVTSFLDKNLLFTDNTYTMVIPEMEVQDIDSEEDWKLAELKFNIFKKNNSL